MGFIAIARLRLLPVAVIGLAAGCGGGGTTGVPLDFGSHPPAAVVLGQARFDATGAGNTLDTFNFPMDAAVTGDGRLIVADARNLLLKTFSNYDMSSTGRAADFLVAHPTTIIATAGSKIIAQRGLNLDIVDPWPSSGGPLSRVSLSFKIGCAADAVGDVGSAHITPLGRLVVADRMNHRVLIWNSIPPAGPLGPAQVVIGQPDMNTCVQNGGGATSAGSLAFPVSVWSDDTRLVVADMGNNRVLVWNSLPGTSQSAHHVVGQSDFVSAAPDGGVGPRASTLDGPRSVDVNDRGQLAVADSGNNRVLIWNKVPTRNGQAADQVIGQPDFETAGLVDPNARNMFAPYRARFHGSNLIVPQPEWNRVMIWRGRE